MNAKNYNLYALKRKDTGEYFKLKAKNPYGQIKNGDPRLSHWTPDLDKAKHYPWKGVYALACQYRQNFLQHGVQWGTPDVEIVKLKVIEEETIQI